jgi:hypothetical protein
VNRRGIREFVARDWRAARDSKDDYWAERISRLGPLEAWRIAEELRRQALDVCPDWPHPSRSEDLRFHVRFAELLRRVDSTRSA